MLQLESTLPLHSALNVTNLLRRCSAVTETELPKMFLERRKLWLLRMLKSESSQKNAQGAQVTASSAYTTLTRATDALRSSFVDVTTQYRAVFVDAEQFRYDRFGVSSCC